MDDIVSHYQTMATALTSQIVEPWTKAWLEGNVNADHSRVQYWYLNSAGETRQASPPSLAAFEASEALINLRQIMKQDGKEPWSRATFTLTPDGKFNLDVEYDD